MDRKRKRGPVVGSSAARGWRKLALPESLFKTSEHEGLLSLEVLDASSEDYESLVRNLKVAYYTRFVALPHMDEGRRRC